METIVNFENWAKNNGWRIDMKEDSVKNLPETILKRYDIPDEYKQFLENVEICTNADENIWFLCINDLFDQENAFRWNEFELMSIEAAEGNSELIAGITDYWDKHFPIIINVRDDYGYYAVNVENKKIVYGYEPEFENGTVVAENFEELLNKIINDEIQL